MDRFVRDGMEFRVRDGGPADGDVVVLLHGFPQTAEAWTDVESRLHAAGMRTLAPDQRGYSPGARPHERSRYAVSELAADVLALLDQAGGGPAHVVGHDWGGAVGWWLAGHHPGRLRSLTVLSTPHPRAMARALVSSPQLLRSSYVALFQLPVLPERLLGPSSQGGGRLAAQLRATGLDADHAAAYSTAMAAPGALSGALAWYRGIPFERSNRAPGTIQVPTRYLWGEKDRFIGRRAAQLTGRFVTGDYRFVPLRGASHWLPETRPTEVAAAVVELAGR